MARSYACVVKGHTKERTDNHKYCKGGVFGASKASKQNPIRNCNPRPCKISIEGDSLTRGGHKSHITVQDNGKSIQVDHTQAEAIQRDSILNGGVLDGADENRSGPHNNNTQSGLMDDQALLFDVRNTESDKFINSIIFNDSRKLVAPLECKAFDQWKVQSKMNFGFIPLTDPILPKTSDISFLDPIKLHEEVKKYNLPNYLGARIPIRSQMNIGVWKTLLKDYWDQQLLQCLEFGFPLGFNRMCPLKHDKENHKSALEFPEDVGKYIKEEKSFGAILGPFKDPPMHNLHFSRSYDALLDVMAQLGITVTKKTLVAPTTQAVCLGILIDTVEGTVAIPPEKLKDITNMVKEWKGKNFGTKCQLQSLLGILLYVHKCVKPARCFLNRMLEMLRNASNPAKIMLSDDFHRDLGWFNQFLPQYNGISMYAHSPSRSILELDACLTGLGGRWENFVYHLPLPRDFRNLDIVHLEMISIVLALRLFAQFWKGKCVKPARCLACQMRQ